MEETSETAAEAASDFMKTLLRMFPREIGTPVTLEEDDLESDDSRWSVGFYVVTPDQRVMDLSTWCVTEPGIQRNVLEAAGVMPWQTVDTDVLSRYGAQLADQVNHSGVEYHGVVFPSLKHLTDWAHAFRMEQYVNIVGTPQLSGAVSVNIAIPAS